MEAKFQGYESKNPYILLKKKSYLLADIKRATAERRTNKFQRLV